MPLKTRILLVRHGATVLTAEDRFAGATDVLLSETGERQAEALQKRLASMPIAAVYASPMKRTVKTATIIAKPHGLEPVLEPGIKEISHGHWEEMTRAEVEEKHNDEYISWDSDPFTYAPPGGESGLEVLSRALPPIRKIVEKHAGETVLVVSHKATIRLLIGSFLGFDLRRYRDNLDQKPCCLNVLDFTVDKPIKARLSLFNDISHYDKAQEKKPTGAHLSKTWAECNDAKRSKTTQ
ncbi:phosphoglycerate mutase [Salpingoeca rosetta]|uniref:Phosphoglycerate mutase n=1 Tax=Salpingoeca rosetta (strain ATCC 50818 / BSB-021) TaxID=946362 RepID=F2UFF3_SALR5|nr:phosphoglycerate mutase [Salpingoeca rosetta]EGD75521.1 phosphoglycerate mutase [Salpingoeca rosetta]|eukprot:XP_004991978.1 phosphoglycerate mutase [Salpingoeca rosetta]